jgi:Family of unknown function (DUF6228)
VLQAQIQDIGPGTCYKGSRVVFTRHWLGPDQPAEAVTLACSDFEVTAHVASNIAAPLLRFLDEIGSLSGDWDGERTFKTVEENLVITCFWCSGGRIHMEVSLDANTYCPAWTVQLRMDVDQAAWGGIIEQFRDYFAVAKETL